jgi:ribosome-associated protein
MIKINDHLSISDAEIGEEFTCSSGPGGQNVNKVATAVRLRFHVASSSLPDSVKSRIFAQLARRINTAGELIVEARTHRTQLLNRQEAYLKMENILRSTLVKVPRRVKTKPTNASKRRRLEQKKHRSDLKKIRRNDLSVD